MQSHQLTIAADLFVHLRLFHFQIDFITYNFMRCVRVRFWVLFFPSLLRWPFSSSILSRLSVHRNFVRFYLCATPSSHYFSPRYSTCSFIRASFFPFNSFPIRLEVRYMHFTFLQIIRTHTHTYPIHIS